MQFLSLLKKTDVHCVWLAKSGRRRLKTMRLQLIIYLIMHGTNLTSIALSSVSIFQLVGKTKPQKKGCKNRHNFLLVGKAKPQKKNGCKNGHNF